MTTELITQSATAALAAYNANDDYVDMRAKDYILPRAQILQPLSVDVMEGGKQAGSIMDSSTKNILVNPKAEGKFIVPIMMWLEWIEWNRDRDCDKDKKVVARSVDPASPLAIRADRWEEFIGTDGKKKVAVTEYFNFIVAVVDEKMSDYEALYIMGFARSSHKTGKVLLNRLSKTKIPGPEGIPVRAPMFLNRIGITTAVETKDNNRFWIPVLGEAKPNPDSHIPLLAKIATDMKARRADIIDRNRNEHTDTEATGGAAATIKSEM